MDTRDEWTRRLDDDEQFEDIRAWNRRCLVWEAVALTAIAVVMGGCTAMAVWLLVTS